jgi:hypothetical protein
VLVTFVTVDGECAARKIFRGTQIGINCEGRKKKINEDLKNSDNYIFKRKLHW